MQCQNPTAVIMLVVRVPVLSEQMTAAGVEVAGKQRISRRQVTGAEQQDAMRHQAAAQLASCPGDAAPSWLQPWRHLYSQQLPSSVAQ